MSPADLETMTPSEVVAAYRARLHYDEARDRAQWERARVVAFFSVLPHAKKGSLRKPADLFPLEWDEGTAPRRGPRRLTAQDREIIRKWEEEAKKNGE